jgi:hypothetical protein
MHRRDGLGFSCAPAAALFTPFSSRPPRPGPAALLLIAIPAVPTAATGAAASAASTLASFAATLLFPGSAVVAYSARVSSGYFLLVVALFLVILSLILTGCARGAQAKPADGGANVGLPAGTVVVTSPALPAVYAAAYAAQGAGAPAVPGWVDPRMSGAGASKV